MAFAKFHGMLLAKNSWIENLHIERLPADPAALDLTYAGRLWFNTTDKVVRYTTLDGTGAVVVKTIQDLESAQAALSALQSSLEGRLDGVDTVLAAEVTRAQAAEAALQTAIDDEHAAMLAAIAQEVTDRNAAIAVAAQNAADAQATETAARIAGDEAATTRMDAVQAELDATQQGVGLDSDGAYVAPVGSNFLTTATSIANATELLDAALKAEETTRIATDAALQSAINNEAQLRADGDTALEARIQAYVDGQITADETQDAAEVAARIAADALIQAELDTTQAAIGLNTDGTFAAIEGSNYMDQATTVYGAAAALDLNLKRVDDALTGEIAARQADTAAATAALSSETADRQAADQAQQEEINRVEAGAGLETDGSFVAPTGSNYLNAATSLKDATLKLDSAVKSEADRAVAAENVLQGQIDALEAAAGDGATALKSAINSGRYTFKSSVAASTYTVQHNLNAEFVQFQIMVEGGDGKFRNDIVPVEEIDANSFRVELSEVRNIKVSVQNVAALA